MQTVQRVNQLAMDSKYIHETYAENIEHQDNRVVE